MKSLIFCIILISTLLVAGCVSPSYNYRAKAIEISEPPLKTVITAAIGDNLVRQGYYSEHDAILVHTDISTGGIAGYVIGNGLYYKKGDDEDSEFYLPGTDAKSGSIKKCGICDPWEVIQAYRKEPKICVITVFHDAVCNDSDSLFERKKVQLLTSDSFQQTLIYNGKVGNKLNIGYREFSNNFARPAFNYNVEYDLNTSNIIGYKGAKLEVLEATNESIKYRVISNFNNSSI